MFVTRHSTPIVSSPPSPGHVQCPLCTLHRRLWEGQLGHPATPAPRTFPARPAPSPLSPLPIRHLCPLGGSMDVTSEPCDHTSIIGPGSPLIARFRAA